MPLRWGPNSTVKNIWNELSLNTSMELRYLLVKSFIQKFCYPYLTISGDQKVYHRWRFGGVSFPRRLQVRRLGRQSRGHEAQRHSVDRRNQKHFRHSQKHLIRRFVTCFAKYMLISSQITVVFRIWWKFLMPPVCYISKFTEVIWNIIMDRY